MTTYRLHWTSAGIAWWNDEFLVENIRSEFDISIRIQSFSGRTPGVETFEVVGPVGIEYGKSLLEGIATDFASTTEAFDVTQRSVEFEDT